MTLLFKQLFSLIKLLNSETGTNQIAWGVACGFILGMTPSLSLQSLLVFACIFIFRIQAGAAFVSAFFFSLAAYLLDPVFHTAGATVLQIDAFQGMYTTLYNVPILPFTRFNNTVVMGSGLISIILAPVVFVLARTLIVKYREKVLAKIQQTKAWKAIKATSLYKWYYKYNELYG